MPVPPLALFAAAVAFLLPVVFSPSVLATFWTPAAALCLVVAAVGLPRLRPLIGEPSTRASALFAGLWLVVGLVSAFASDNPRLAVLGLYYWGTGWLFIASLVGAWAVGRSINHEGRRLVETAIIAAGLLNATIAVLEAIVDLDAFHLGRYGGRSPGLLGNPVHLGAFAAAALTLVAPRFRRAPRRWAPAVILLAAGVQTSGSRFGLIVLVGVVVWVFGSCGRHVGVAIAALALSGLIVGTVAASGIDGGSQIASGRAVTTAGSGVTPRLQTWRDALEAALDRPLLGWGPGRFRTATSPRRGVEIARHEGPDRVFVDAHNFVAEYGVTTGLVGLLALVGMLLFARRGAHGPLLAFAVAEFANHLVEPQAVRTTPVVFLALGAAAAGAPHLPRLGRTTFVTACTATAIAVGAASALIVGDFHLEQARLDFGRNHARRAYTLLPWPESAEIRARVFLFDGRVQRDDRLTRRGTAFLRVAVDRDDTNPNLWTGLGYRHLGDGDLALSAAAFERALRYNPVSTVARNGLARVALARRDARRAAEWARSSLDVVPGDGAARKLLREAEALARTRNEGAGE